MFYTKQDRDTLKEEFNAGIQAQIESSSPALESNLTELFEKDIEELRILVRHLSESVNAAVPVGFPIPKFQSHVTAYHYDSGKVKLRISIRSIKASLVHGFKFENEWILENTTAVDIFEFLSKAALNIVLDSMSKVNIETMNTLFAEMTDSEHANRDYTISFIPRVEATVGSNPVEYISDKEIVFVIPRDNSFDIPSLVMTADIPEDIDGETGLNATNQLMRDRQEAARSGLESELSALDRPVDVLAKKISVIKMLADIRTHQPSTLIRKSFHRKAESLGLQAKVNLVGFYQNDDGVIGAVERDGQTGNFSVVLSPIDKKTLQPVENFDLVKAVQDLNA